MYGLLSGGIVLDLYFMFRRPRYFDKRTDQFKPIPWGYLRRKHPEMSLDDWLLINSDPGMGW